MNKQVNVDFMARTEQYDQGMKKMSQSTKNLQGDINGMNKPVGEKMGSSLTGLVAKIAGVGLAIKLLVSHWGLISGGVRKAVTASLPHLDRLRRGSAGNKVSDEFKKMTLAVEQFGNTVKATANKSVVPMGRLASTLNPSAKIGLGLAALGVGLALSLAAPAKYAIDLEKDMRNLNVVLRTSDDRLDKLQTRFLKMSQQKGMTSSARELSQAAYDIASTGFDNPTEVAVITEQAGKGAAAGMTDAKTAASALLTVMSAYNLTASESGRVNDILFKTVEVGRVNFEQLSLQVGDFIGIGRASGASVEELMAGYSNMTLSTGNSAKAATALNAVLRQMVTPSKELASLYKLWGYSSGEAAIKGMGLQKTVERIRASTGGSSEALQKLIPDVEGMTGVFALTSRSSEEMNANVAKFTDPAQLAGAAANALAEQGKSTSAELTRLKNTIIANATVVGKSLLPAIKMAATAMAEFLGVFQKLPGWMQSSIGIIGGMSAVLLVLGGSGLYAYSKIKTLIDLLKVVQGAKAFGLWANQLPLVGTGLSAVNGRMKALIASSAKLQWMTTHFAALKLSAAAAAGSIALVFAGIYAGNKLASKMSENRFGKVDDKDLRQMGVAFNNIDVASAKAGKSTGTFAAEIDRLNAGAQDKGFVDNVKTIFGAYDKKDELANSLKNIDKAAAEVVKSGNAEKARLGIELLSKSSGKGVKELTDQMPEYTIALEENAMAAEVNLAVAKLQQDELTITGDKTKQALRDTEGYTKSIEDLTKMTKDWLSLSKTMKGAMDLSKGRKDAKDASAERVRDEKDGIKTIADAEKDLKKEQSEQGLNARKAAMDVAKARKDLADLSKPKKRDAGDDPEDQEQKALDRAQAELDLAEALDAQRNIGEGVAGAMDKVAEAKDRVKVASEKSKEALDKEKFSLGDFATSLQAQMASYQTFNANLEALARAGWQYEQIQQIKGMGEEGVELAAALAAAPAAEQDKVRGLLSSKMQMELEDTNRVLDAQLAMTIAIGRTGAMATKDAILAEMAKIAPGLDVMAPIIQDAVAKMMAAGGVGVNVTVGQPSASTSAADARGAAEASGMPNRGRYDSGGILKPGTTIATNKTGRDEYVFTAPQLQKVVSIARNTGGNQITPVSQKTETHFHGDINGANFKEIKSEGERVKRRNNLTGAGI